MSLLPFHSGDPLVFIDYWRFSGPRLPSLRFDEKSYPYDEERPLQLEQQVKELHQIGGNAPDWDPHVVFGNGSTQVLHGLLLTLAKRLRSSVGQDSHGDNHEKPSKRAIKIWYQKPYYMVMNELLEMDANFTYADDPKDAEIEIVISPNNPTGELVVAHCPNAQYTIYDRAYNWGLYCDSVDKPSVKETISIYTSSKLFGTGGLRIGWVLLQDAQLAEEVRATMFKLAICPSSPGMRFLSAILESLLGHGGQPFHKMIEQLRATLVKRHRFLESLLPWVSNHDGPYAWLYHPEQSIVDVMQNQYGVEVSPGSRFGLDDHYGRFSLICDETTWKRFVTRVTTS